MGEPKLWCHSNLDVDGREYINVIIEEPRINGRDLYDGGRYLHFDVDNRKLKTECSLYHFRNGAPQFDKTIGVWKEETWCESECLKFIREWVMNGRKDEGTDEHI